MKLKYYIKALYFYNTNYDNADKYKTECYINI